MRDRRAGFTFSELTVALVIGSVLTSVAVKSAGPVLTRTSVRTATHTFETLHARARAHAIERGEVIRLWIDSDRDRIWVTTGSEVIDMMDFSETQDVDIESEPSLMVLCFNPRGFGERGCTSFDTSVTVSFEQGANSSQVKLWPLGQLDS
jgi:prepilin-type N-terminal cleavage/methylation domain-containing protein